MCHAALTQCSTKGFTLIEVLVTLAITTIGLVGLSAMMIEADRTAKDSGNKSQAIWMAEDLINRIAGNYQGAYSTLGEDVDCSAVPAFVCAAYFDGAAKVNPINCNPIQMATYDLWEVACPRDIAISGSDFVRTGSNSHVINPRVQVSGQQPILIQVIWDSRTGGLDAAGNRIYVSDSELMAEPIATRTESIVMEFNP